MVRRATVQQYKKHRTVAQALTFGRNDYGIDQRDDAYRTRTHMAVQTPSSVDAAVRFVTTNGISIASNSAIAEPVLRRASRRTR